MKVFVVLLIGATIALSFSRFGVYSLLMKRPAAKTGLIHWYDLGSTPLAEKRFTPQGMTWVNGMIIFANTWKDKKSRIYEIDPQTMARKRFFDMPHGALHTSGLAWDSKFLWAVDYRANRAYCIDLEPSLIEGSARVIGSFKTMLNGTSACCIVLWKNQHYLAISDFMNSRKTIFIRHYEALAEGDADNYIEFSYRNEGFSQGLEYFDGYLYESENKFGKDIINKIDLEKLTLFRNSRDATVAQYRAPGNGVEDLAWSGDALWTSDESVFRFFKGMFPNTSEK